MGCLWYPAFNFFIIIFLNDFFLILHTYSSSGSFPPTPPILPHPTSLSTPQERYPAFKTQNRTFLDFFFK